MIKFTYCYVCAVVIILLSEWAGANLGIYFGCTILIIMISITLTKGWIHNQAARIRIIKAKEE